MPSLGLPGGFGALGGLGALGRSWELVTAPTDAHYRHYQPRRGDPSAAAVNALYAAQFDELRQLELQAGAADTLGYAVNFQTLYQLRRGPDRQLIATRLAQLPFASKALCKGPNGDLYLASAAAPDARTLYRFDPRTRRLFRSNLALPRLLDATDEWLSAAAVGDRLYLLNAAGNNLVELAPGRVPRNVLASALRASQPPGFVGKVLNMTVGPDRTFYLKENFSPTLWMFTERDGVLKVAPPVTLTWDAVTGAIAVLPGPPGAAARLLLGEFNGANSQLIAYDLATHRARPLANLQCTDLALTPVRQAAAPWPSATDLTGWFRGLLYVDYVEQPALGLHFQPGGQLDSVTFGKRALAVDWHYRQRDATLEISADPAFADYVAWYGGGRRTQPDKTTTLTLALQSSLFDALNQLLGAANPVPFAYSAGTEGFAQLTATGPPSPAPPPPLAVEPPPPPIAPPPVVAPPEKPPVASRPQPRVSDSLFCTGAEILVEAADYNIVDGDQVQFFMDDKPLTGVITLRRKPQKFHFPCPSANGLLIMKTISAGQGPCTARLTIRQGDAIRQLRLESSVEQASALKFFRR